MSLKEETIGLFISKIFIAGSHHVYETEYVVCHMINYYQSRSHTCLLVARIVSKENICITQLQRLPITRALQSKRFRRKVDF